MKNTKNLTRTAIMLALVFAITRFIQIPIPLGYLNIGNTIIMSICLLIPAPYGLIAASFGSALADFTSFPVYTLPTFVIKFIFPLAFYLLMKLPIKKKLIKVVIAAGLSTLIPLLGYTITGMILYGGFYAGLAQFPGLLAEYIINMILTLIIAGILIKRNITKFIE